MGQPPTVLDPWRLVRGQPYIDSRTLAAAIEQDLARTDRPDFRTRLLVRDAAVALRSYWGKQRFAQWLEASPAGSRILEIMGEDLGETGFHAIRKRLVDSNDSTQIRQVLELLGRGIEGRVEIHIGGSIPTLLKGLTVRPTDGIDLVDRVPEVIRCQRDVLRQIQAEFGLNLSYFSAHHLPARWRDRREWFGDFGGLRAFLLEEYDIFVAKLPSEQRKHQIDTRVLGLELDREKARHRLLTDGLVFLDDPKLRPQIEENWRFIFQEPLFPDPDEERAAGGDPAP